MFCSNCGVQLDDNTRFCPECGIATGKGEMGLSAIPGNLPQQPPQQTGMIQGQKVTENIYFCPDGYYRWIYEFRMMSNPTILFTIWKIFGGILVGVWLFSLLLALIDGDLNGEYFLDTTKNMGIVLVVMLVIAFLAYLIVAGMNGWKYIVLFEMNDQGITHTQMQKQFKKAQAIGWVTAMAGLLAANPAMMGLGINTAVQSSMSSDFSKVKNIKVYRGRGVIKVNEMLNKNQVYADRADFDFVLNYIRARIPNDAKGK